MTVWGAFYSRLSTDETILGYVQDEPIRIYPVQAPKDTALPNITIEVDGGDEDRTQVNDDNLVESGVQVTIWAKKHRTAELIGNRVRALMSGQKWTGDSTNIQHCLLTFFSDMGTSERTQIYGIVMGFSIMWKGDDS